MSGSVVRAHITGALLIGSLTLTACAQFSVDGGMSAVGDLAGRPLNKSVVAIRSAEDEWAVRNRIEALLRKRLSADDAVQIALLNNRDLQAAYNALGISEAETIAASLPPNPKLSVSRIAGSGSFELESQAVASVLALATLPARADIAADRWHAAQARAAEMTLRIAATARRAYYRAVAAQALADFLTQAQASAEAAAAISKRLGESGTLNKLDQARNQAFSAELTAQLGTARLRMESEREALVRIMGLWGHDLSFRLPKALPRLPMRPRTLPRVEADAIRRRLDLQIARLELSAMAKSYGLTRATRFINVLDAGFKGKTARENGDAVREHGFDLELEVPLFDFGEVRAREAEETYMQAINRLVAKAVNVRSEARDAYHTYRGAYDIARHYRNEVLPLRRIISDETLLRYNAMQIDVFALLAEARQRINSSMAAIEAERDFWLAQTALDAAILGGNTSDADRPPVSGGVAIPDTQ